MGDAMLDKDTRCDGCINWKGSYSMFPCSQCSMVFSGMLKNYYVAKETTVLKDKQEVDRGLELAEAHWNYIESLMEAHLHTKDEIRKAKFHYISAFVHGYKHALEDVQ